MGDVNNHYESLDRSLKKIGMVLVDDLGLLRNGKASQCLDLLRRLLLTTSVTVAKQLLSRGCPSHATDKKLVSAAFELLRDRAKFIPSLTVDQFFKEGFAAHKLAILVKLSCYIAEVDKSFQRAPSNKIMYVVPVEVNLNSTAYMDETEEDNDDMNEVTAYDDSKAFSSPGTAATAPQQTLPSSARKSAATAAVSAAPPREPDWPQTDFIKQHILDAKLRSTAKGSSSSPAGRTLSRHASFTPSSNKSRSTTPTSMRQSASFRRDDSVTASLSGIDIYDIEEKTAALEAIQALRAQRKGPSSASPKHSREMLNNQDRNNQQNNSFSNGQYNSYSSNSLTELAAESNVSFSDTPTATRGAGGNSEYSRPTLSPQRSAESFPQQSGGSNEQNATSSSGGGSASATTTAAAQLNPNSDFAVFVQQTVDLAVQQRLSNDPELQKLIDARVEAVVEQRVQQAVADITTKYDFIINKLVAAVDAEFTLLNNKLALQQQVPHEHQY